MDRETNLGIFANYCENGGNNHFTHCFASSLTEEQRQDLLNNPGSVIVHSVKKKVFGGNGDHIVSITCNTQEGFNVLLEALSL